MKSQDDKLVTSLDELRALWAAGDYRRALRLVAGWARLGDDRNVIQSGWGAAAHPENYRQIGKDPDVLYMNALGAIAKRYKLEPPKEALT